MRDDGLDAATVNPLDSTISDDPTVRAGSGADRLLLGERDWRVKVQVLSETACMGNRAPGAPRHLDVLQFSDPHDAHRFARLRFVAPSDDVGIMAYEVRVSTEVIDDETSFERARPAQAASTDSIALAMPTDLAAGQIVEADFGGLAPLTHYHVALRAVDFCNQKSAFAATEYTTPPGALRNCLPMFYRDRCVG